MQTPQGTTIWCRDCYSVLHLRFRMPISDDLHSRSIIIKITKYDKVSMSVLSDILPISVQMEENVKGTLTFTNLRVTFHNEILRLYKEHVARNFTWENFTAEEQSSVTTATRERRHPSHQR